MNGKIFISGSIAIKKIPLLIQQSIDKIIKNNLTILVGDANGVDSLIQDYCTKKKYYNVIVYTVTSNPRYIASNQFSKKTIIPDNNIKSKRKIQQEKDKQMTNDSEYSLIVWDGASKGSFANIVRAIDSNKILKVYLLSKNKFLEKRDKSKLKIDIEFIFRENNGYTATEVIKLLTEQGYTNFKRAQDLYSYLCSQKILIKKDDSYLPQSRFSEYFIIQKYRGKIKGIKFKNEFIGWAEKKIPKTPIQQNIFS